ncbi:ribitol-5-phosphate xylosyltransferase 1-like, partial [Ruditapes philippinarum]|uniref:ribitol-5-phosphate xylosyltransferase 1-like n=1 Tax=Ruditapes philippinarum TaxID=129788 RepID=UPI00295A7228
CPQNSSIIFSLIKWIFLYISELAEDDEDWNPWGEEFENEQLVISHHEPPKILWNLEPKNTVSNKGNNTTNRIFNVEVWGKAAIGLYLWEHILEASLEERMGGVWSYGAKTVNNITFTFRTGPGVIPEQVPKDTENLLLILNGREPDKVQFAETWLKSLHNLSQLRNVGLVLLGNEQCNNSWLHNYMHYNGGLVKFVFLVYDSPEIDNVNFYQWPLGVATYRNFPTVDSSKLPVHIHRQYSCNFLGTIYKNSSRETLMKILEGDFFREKCFIKARKQWLPLETDSTREQFIQALSQSDLTLNPVGVNTECYRIYEAITFGSVPVVEDIMTPGHCGRSKSSSSFPLRLLKEMDAPLMYIKDWSELSKIIENEKKLRHSEIVKRRRNLLLWYESFKSKMRQKLIHVINKHFFGLNR